MKTSTHSTGARGAALALLCIALMSAALIGCGRTEKRAILVYMVGSDLESDGGAATADMEEMRLSGADTASLDLFVMTGGSTAWRSDVPTDRNVIYRLDGDEWTEVQRTPVQNMGEPATLTKFLNDCASFSTASTFSLILWDHGGGPLEGCGYDSLHGDDRLTLPEMRAALSDSVFGEGKRLLFVGFDACLMASLETAAAFDGLADYLIASQEAVPNRGWNYRFLSDERMMTGSGADAGRAVVESYLAYYGASGDGAGEGKGKKPATLSCMDLSKTKAVVRAMDALFGVLTKELDNGAYSDIARKRGESKSFGRFTMAKDYDLVDLGSLADEVGAYGGGRADALRRAIDEFVVVNGTNQASACGVSVFYPYENGAYLMRVGNGYRWQSELDEAVTSPVYAAFLGKFSDVQTAERLASWDGPLTIRPAGDALDGAPSYAVQLTQAQAENFSNAAYYIIGNIRGEEYEFYYMSRDVTLDEDNVLRTNFHNAALQVASGAGSKSRLPVAFEEETEGAVTRYCVYATLTRGELLDGYEMQNVIFNVECVKSTGECAIVSVLPLGGAADTESAAADADDRPRGKQEIDLTRWDTVQFMHCSRYAAYDDGGKLLPFGRWIQAGAYRGYSFPVAEGVEFFFGPIEETTYDLHCILSIKDTQGNVYASSIQRVRDASVPAPQSPDGDAPVNAFSYTVNEARQVVLLSENGVTVTLDNIAVERDAYAGLDQLKLYVTAKNGTAQDVSLSCEKVKVNGFSFLACAFFNLSPGETASETVVLSVDDGKDSNESLRNAGVERIERIALTVRGYSDTVPDTRAEIDVSYDLSGCVRPYRVQTEDFPLAPGAVYEENGVTLKLLRAFFDTANEDVLYLRFALQNGSDVLYDRIQLQGFCFNGILVSDIGATVNAVGRGEQFVTLRVERGELAESGVFTVEQLAFDIAFYKAGSAAAIGFDTVPNSVAHVTLTPQAAGLLYVPEDGAKQLLLMDGLCIEQLLSREAGVYGRKLRVTNRTGKTVSMYVESALLNGAPTKSYFLSVSELPDGGVLYLYPGDYTLCSELRKEGVQTGPLCYTLTLRVHDDAANGVLMLTDPIALTFG